MAVSTLVDRDLTDAALACFSRWGVAKTTLDDIAREAGCSRATVYRLFPGGKDVLLDAVAGRELARFFEGLRTEVERAAGDLEDLLVAGVTYAARAIRDHRALQFLLAHEPEVVLPLVAFDRLDVVLDHAAAFCAPWLEPHVGQEWAPRAGEWITRMVLSYSLVPADGFDLTAEADARRFVRSFVMPGLTSPHRSRKRTPPMTSTNEEIIGRADINDLEAILSVTNKDVDALVSHVKSEFDTIFTWDYEKGQRPKLNRLYEKAKTSMWNGETDLPWETEVDQEAVVMANAAQVGGIGAGMDVSGTPFAKWGDKEWIQLGVESQNWTLSQFMHGEQGALICTARIVENVPWIDAKYYAATQVMDEARHVEVFAKYLDTKLSGHYPVNAHLKLLLDDIIQDNRWDMTYLGMQIMVEGLALAAFGFIHQLTTEPLLKQLLRYVMSDEARHVAFGVLSLQDYYKELDAAELRERQEFAFEAAVRMRDRFLQQEVWDRMGLDVKDVLPFVMNSPERAGFQTMLFSKIVPNCKKLGLLDAGATNGKPGWLREKFTELGVIAFEDWADTGEEYEMFALAEGETMESTKSA